MVKLESSSGEEIEIPEVKALEGSRFINGLKIDFDKAYNDSIFTTPFTKQELIDLKTYFTSNNVLSLLERIYRNEGVNGLINFYQLGNFFDIPLLREAIGKMIYEKTFSETFPEIEETSNGLCQNAIAPYLNEEFLKETSIFELNDEPSIVGFRPEGDLTLSEEIVRHASSCQQAIAILEYLELPEIDLTIRNLRLEHTPTENTLYYFSSVVARFSKYKNRPVYVTGGSFLLMIYSSLDRQDFIIYDQDMKKLAEGHLMDGKLNGPYRIWDSEGNIEAEGQYINGNASGYWRYYEDGDLVSHGENLNGKRNGLWESFVNGRKSSEIIYQDGIEISRKRFLPSGEEIPPLYPSSERSRAIFGGSRAVFGGGGFQGPDYPSPQVEYPSNLGSNLQIRYPSELRGRHPPQSRYSSYRG